MYAQGRRVHDYEASAYTRMACLHHCRYVEDYESYRKFFEEGLGLRASVGPFELEVCPHEYTVHTLVRTNCVSTACTLHACCSMCRLVLCAFELVYGDQPPFPRTRWRESCRRSSR